MAPHQLPYHLPAVTVDPATLDVTLGPASEAPGGTRGAILDRWFAGLAAGHVRPTADSVLACLAELDEHEH